MTEEDEWGNKGPSGRQKWFTCLVQVGFDFMTLQNLKSNDMSGLLTIEQRPRSASLHNYVQA